MHAPLSLTPVEPALQVFGTMSLLLGASTSPSALAQGVGFHEECISGLYHAAYTLAVYASQSRLPVVALRPRKTRFRLVTNLVRAGFDPQGFVVRFLRSSTSGPPHPGLA